MITQVVADLNGDVRSVGWVSLQPDGDVSVGLSDRTFVAPSFRARNLIWSVDNRVTLKYLVKHTPETLKPVANPHLTFHPPIYFHLRENDKDELWAGIADVWIMLEQEGRVPWVRFVSKPFMELKQTTRPRDPAKTTFEKVTLACGDCSIGLGVDFLRKEGETPPAWVTRNFSGATAGVGIDIFACVMPSQISTLEWLHQY